jgi:ABC-type amino acid transport substrate-binding protein
MRRALLLLCLLLGLGVANAEALVFVAASNHAEPLSRFEEGQLVGGLVKDLGDLLARQLGRQPRYLTLPSKRAPLGLRNGDADLICYSRPEWIGADLHWTPMFIPNAEVIAGAAGAPPLRRIEQLEGQTIGTVLGYQYGQTELQGRFRRDDAPDMAANLRKLAAGRMPYALSDEISLLWAKRQHPALHQALLVYRFAAGCALSPRARLSPQQLDAAVQALVKSGAIERLLAGYR